MSLALLMSHLPAYNNVLRTCLPDFGIQVMCVSSGLDGFRLAQRHTPDIVFIDLVISASDWSAYKTAREFRRESALNMIPMIAVTSLGAERHARQAGITDFLVRPYTGNDLRRLLHRYSLVASKVLN